MDVKKRSTGEHDQTITQILGGRREIRGRIIGPTPGWEQRQPSKEKPSTSAGAARDNRRNGNKAPNRLDGLISENYFRMRKEKYST